MSAAISFSKRILPQGDGLEYVGFVNREADEDSKRAGKYRGRDGKPDVRLTAFYRALVSVVYGQASRPVCVCLFV
jgi:hypothetical protein